jgi:hypothetical protein
VDREVVMRRQRPKVARTLHPVMDGDAVNRALTRCRAHRSIKRLLTKGII